MHHEHVLYTVRKGSLMTVLNFPLFSHHKVLLWRAQALLATMFFDGFRWPLVCTSRYYELFLERVDIS